ncbi:MAG TPA: GNAT family N-acetyltransferase [Ignavibacteria bacterium]|nr:GNAT family N-acetyltransferase [Ignavibacteria bacterium]
MKPALNILIRKARKEDSKNILRLINELAEFENLVPPDSAAKKRLIKDAFSEDPPFRILLAKKSNIIVGYAFYLFTYSSFLAKKTLYLEDIFISGKYRNQGIGKLFFKKLTQIAKKNKCGRMEWVVLDWNVNAIKFYYKLGAKELKEWKTYRMII